MARNVKPLTTRLTIKDFWYSMTLPLNESPSTIRDFVPLGQAQSMCFPFSPNGQNRQDGHTQRIPLSPNLSSFARPQTAPIDSLWYPSQLEVGFAPALRANPKTHSLKNRLITQGFSQKPKACRVQGGYLNKGSNEVVDYLFINNLIWGCFLKLGILTSDIRLSKTCLGDMTIYFLYYPLKTPPKQRSYSSALSGFAKNQSSAPAGFVRQTPKTYKNYICHLLSLLKSIILLKYPQLSIKFVCVKAAHSLIDPKILNDLIKFSVAKNPKFFKPVLQQYLKKFKGCARRKINRSFKKRSHTPMSPAKRKGFLQSFLPDVFFA